MTPKQQVDFERLWEHKVATHGAGRTYDMLAAVIHGTDYTVPDKAEAVLLVGLTSQHCIQLLDALEHVGDALGYWVERLSPYTARVNGVSINTKSAAVGTTQRFREVRKWDWRGWRGGHAGIPRVVVWVDHAVNDARKAAEVQRGLRLMDRRAQILKDQKEG